MQRYSFGPQAEVSSAKPSKSKKESEKKKGKGAMTAEQGAEEGRRTDWGSFWPTKSDALARQDRHRQERGYLRFKVDGAEEFIFTLDGDLRCNLSDLCWSGRYLCCKCGAYFTIDGEFYRKWSRQRNLRFKFTRMCCW